MNPKKPPFPPKNPLPGRAPVPKDKMPIVPLKDSMQRRLQK